MQDKREALAKYLNIEVDSIEEQGETFVVNASKRLQGNAPQYYIDSVAEFKALLSNEEIAMINDYLAMGAINGHEEYKKAGDNLYKLIEQTLPNTPVIKDWLYNVNILYWLVKADKDESTHIKIVKAWNGEAIEDDRELVDIDDGEYLVLTDDEADEQARESVEQLVDDMLPREFVESGLRAYFDDERYIDDVLLGDGRGSILASYDGEENEAGEYFVYRIN